MVVSAPASTYLFSLIHEKLAKMIKADSQNSLFSPMDYWWQSF